MQSPAQFIESYSQIGKKKSENEALRLFLLAMLAGFLIGLAALTSTVASYAIANPSLAQLVSGLVFGIGLVLVIFSGAELFTGNNLIVISVMDGTATWGGLLRNWILVYLGNFVGSLLLAAAYILPGDFLGSKGALALTIMQKANAKCSYGFGQALVLGILCNLVVCLAVMVSLMNQDAAGKAIGAYLPVVFFVIAGFEHSIANMYYISAGLFAHSLPQAEALLAENGVTLARLTWSGFFAANLLPVTLGNILGGVGFSWLVYRSHKQA